jgi:predicted transcriptional regulator YdeE
VNVVERDALRVMYVSRRDSAADAAPQAFEELERKLGDLRGRKFYGAFFPREDEYRACVVMQDEDASDLGLTEGVLPGGRYAKTTLRGEPDEIYPRIGATFDELAGAVSHDRERPSLEFYRRRDEVVLLLPIRG